MMTNTDKNWQRDNLRRIKRQLIWLHNKEDGILFKQEQQEKSLVIVKSADDIGLYFMVNTDDPQKPLFSGVMSQINIKDPLYPHSMYQQVMLLGLLFAPIETWHNTQQYTYMMGFGGGRLPMILHHYFPQMIIHGSETDADILKFAEMCFGIAFDERMQAVVQDGREHLTQSKTHYDIIIIDCFANEGTQPQKLATQEFYQLCQARLSLQGVVITNLDATDSLFATKKTTFINAFNYSYGLRHVNNYILFGSNSCDLNTQQIQQRTHQLLQKRSLELPLEELSTAIEKLTIKHMTDIDILVDDN